MRIRQPLFIVFAYLLWKFWDLMLYVFDSVAAVSVRDQYREVFARAKALQALSCST
jgi:hypothetical protein